jgi:PAS domain S-box-containing protein
MLFLRQESELLLQGVHPKDPDWQHEMPRVRRLGQCLCGLALERGEPVYSKDIRTDPRCTLGECCAAGMSSFAALPLLMGTDVLGVLGLASRTECDFAERSALLQALAGNIAIGIQNAMLHQEVRRHAAGLEQEVVERRRAEAALRESEERFRSLFENAPICIFEVDLAQAPHTIVAANFQAGQAYRWSSEAFTPMPVSAVFSKHSSTDLERLVRALGAGEAVTLESNHVRRDGSSFPVRISAAPDSSSDPSRVILAVEDITAERHRRSEEEAIAEERRRIAREIHDGLAQNLASLRLKASLWHAIIDQNPAQMHKEVDAMREFLRDQIREVRRSIFALRPVALDELGFHAALCQFVDDFGQQNQVHTSLDVRGPEDHLPSHLEPVAFRIIQEALNNVGKHAQATSVWIELDLRATETLTLKVRDDGRGFDLAVLSQAVQLGHLGLQQMRERVAELGGTLSVQSQAGEGTEIQVVLHTLRSLGGI